MLVNHMLSKEIKMIRWILLLNWLSILAKCGEYILDKKY